MPGADAFADENGEFKIEIRPWETSEQKKVVHLVGLEPNEKVSLEIEKGQHR